MVYNGSGGADFLTELSGHTSSQELCIGGFLAQKISRKYPVAGEDFERYSVIESPTINSWIPSNGSNLYGHSETVLEAFLRTITADVQFRDGKVFKRPHKFEWVDSPPAEDSSSEEVEELTCRKLAVFEATYGCRLIYTEAGLMGLAPAAATIGDKLCVLFGGQVLYVIRAREDGRHEFIGECYVHGLMVGEALLDMAYLDNIEKYVIC